MTLACWVKGLAKTLAWEVVIDKGKVEPVTIPINPKSLSAQHFSSYSHVIHSWISKKILENGNVGFE